MTHDFIVIGTGLFGCMAARRLRRAGADVLLIGERRDDSASPAAGCVIRPSWLSSMSREDIDTGMGVLADMYDLKPITFSVLGKSVACHRVEPSEILSEPQVNGCVLEIKDNTTIVLYPQQPCVAISAKRCIIVAAGIWTGDLMPGLVVKGRYGWSHRSAPVQAPSIHVWAPYRQIVAYNMDDGNSWVGDGQAVIAKSANVARRAASVFRCGRIAPGIYRTTRGARPYADTQGEPCLIERRGSVVALTGGGKNGTIAAAWAARQMEELL
jgi:glycine/D-amino acid oxidase-like deaminating enzyme